MSEPSPAEITWQLMLTAMSSTQVDSNGGQRKDIFSDSNEVSWIRLLAKDDLIEIIDGARWGQAVP